MIELKQHIELRGDDLLAAVMAGTNINVHLVANMALQDGVYATTEQYDLSLAEVYAALAFYYDHQAAIETRRLERQKLIHETGVDAEEYLATLRKKNNP